MRGHRKCLRGQGTEVIFLSLDLTKSPSLEFDKKFTWTSRVNIVLDLARDLSLPHFCLQERLKRIHFRLEKRFTCPSFSVQTLAKHFFFFFFSVVPFFFKFHFLPSVELLNKVDFFLLTSAQLWLHLTFLHGKLMTVATWFIVSWKV